MDGEQRIKWIGSGVIVAVGAVITTLLFVRMNPEGLPGEWLAYVMGMATTPFIMEATFLFLGFMLIVWINHVRRVKDGDEFVELDSFKDHGDRKKPGGR
ncbi:MAG: hypothetical protein V4733_12175 [Verrucomicrobiota bacterium]